MKITDCKVELLDTMGDDISVVNAARVSFHKESGYMYDEDDPTIEYLSEKDQKLLKYLADHNHILPFAHAFLSFRIKAPIFIARQLGKHQVGLAWNEVSRRYVDDEPEFFLPKDWRKKASNVKQGSSSEVILSCKVEIDEGIPEYININTYSKYIIQFLVEAYNNLINAGVCPEQARMILPQNMMTEWIWSGSLLAFIRVCNLRLDAHTQKETQDVAKEIAHHLDMRFPESWKVCKKFNENL
jgi:thymidylate synthase (FAD)